MILEVVIATVKNGTGDEYEVAFRAASKVLETVTGYRGHNLHRCVEAPDQFLFTIQWESLEAHTIGFRGSPQYQEWKRLLHHFYDPFPVVEHYTAVSLTS